MPQSPSLQSDREIYARAPVVEAAIDIRCVNRPNFTMADIAILSESFSDDFQQEAEAYEVDEEVRADGTRRRTERPVGVMLRSVADPRSVLQLQVEGMALSRLGPYERWEPFRDDARRLWTLYSDAAKPQVISRLGVRYINRIIVGDVVDDLRPFLNIYPVTPWGMRSPPTGFSLQIRHPLDQSVTLVVNQGTITDAKTKQIAVLLDLDAIIQHELPASTEAVWNEVERLHVEVEKAFESAITDRVREMIR